MHASNNAMALINFLYSCRGTIAEQSKPLTTTQNDSKQRHYHSVCCRIPRHNCNRAHGSAVWWSLPLSRWVMRPVKRPRIETWRTVKRTPLHTEPTMRASCSASTS